MPQALEAVKTAKLDLGSKARRRALPLRRVDCRCMSSPQIALLRGINVGGRGKLPMKDLARIIGDLGGTEVQTYIQSGNVVFEAARAWGPEQCAALVAAIEAEKGFSPPVFLLQVEQLRRAIADNPFPTGEGKALHFYFLASPAAPDLDRVAELAGATEQYRLTDAVFYLYAPDGIGRSKLAAKLESLLRVPTTARNWNTVHRLAQMSGAL